MEHHISNHDFSLINVFGITVGKNGFSNELFHLDDTHLGSDAIPELEKQFKS